ncbi:MarR family winged helix-turn-helix transcriptional regulator [Gordonia sp. (in: high G+C Gram-positive bacteria)]|uniref:MarR family winged helix-turn-helix transcriptional regulator n=1 Tax=unclassified Gordonia (in: high G+C Gram-positive bacteria) TaxID=2657482 RepID=UPI002602F30E|nr:MarR family transcriptional regulator [Gordonia sp. (in: high G+C Gram-positive bacteria)]
MTEADPAAIGRLRAAVTRLYLSLRRNSPSTELTAAHASAIATLTDHGPMRMGDFAQRESIRMPSATTLIDTLARKEMVQRRPDPDDRRAVLVELTDHGREAVAELRTHRDEVLAAAVESLPPEHRAALIDALPALTALQAALERCPGRDSGE